MKFTEKQSKWIIIIGIIILILSMQSTSTSDKKEGIMNSIGLGFGGTIIVLGLLGLATPFAPVAIAMISIGGLIALPSAFGQIFDIFNMFKPQPLIPIWVWLAGGALLLIIVMKKKQ